MRRALPAMLQICISNADGTASICEAALRTCPIPWRFRDKSLEGVTRPGSHTGSPGTRESCGVVPPNGLGSATSSNARGDVSGVRLTGLDVPASFISRQGGVRISAFGEIRAKSTSRVHGCFDMRQAGDARSEIGEGGVRAGQSRSGLSGSCARTPRVGVCAANEHTSCRSI
jgi:hypothetical protein